MRQAHQLKFLEIRDRATFIPVIAIDCTLSGNAHDDYLLQRMGFDRPYFPGQGRHCHIAVVKLSSGMAQYNPYAWDTNTMREAHLWIEAHWDEFITDEVIDVEYIGSHINKPKTSERHDQMTPLIPYAGAPKPKKLPLVPTGEYWLVTPRTGKSQALQTDTELLRYLREHKNCIVTLVNSGGKNQ